MKGGVRKTCVPNEECQRLRFSFRDKEKEKEIE